MRSLKILHKRNIYICEYACMYLTSVASQTIAHTIPYAYYHVRVLFIQGNLLTVVVNKKFTYRYVPVILA